MTEHAEQPLPGPILLEAVAAEIEAFVGQAGWDQVPSLYALVPTRALAADPAAAELLAPGDPDEIPAEAITPARVREIHREQLAKLEAERGEKFWVLA